MAEITLKAETGRTTGTRSSRRLRAFGLVPCVVYGLGEDPVSAAVEWKPLREALTTDAGFNVLVDLEIEGETALCIVKDMQRHAIRGDVLHVDFLRVSRDATISVEVPILVEGEAEEVMREDGTVDLVLFHLTVNAKPADIPNDLVVDVSDMVIGDTIRVGDLPLPSGVTTDVDPEEAVVIAQISRATIEAEQIAEADAELAAEQSEEDEEGGEAKADDAGDDGDAKDEGEGGGDEG